MPAIQADARRYWELTASLDLRAETGEAEQAPRFKNRNMGQPRALRRFQTWPTRPHRIDELATRQ